MGGYNHGENESSTKKVKVVSHTLGTLIYAFSQWVILWLITRVSGLEVAGSYVLYLSFLTPVAILCNLGLRNYIAGDVHSKSSDTAYILVRVTGITILVAITVLFYFTVENTQMLILVCLIKAFDSSSELIYGNWIRLRKPELYGVSQFTRLLLFATLLVLMYTLVGSHLILAYMYPLSMLITYFLFDSKMSMLQFVPKKVNKREIKILVFSSLPLALGSVVLALNVTVVRSIVDFQLGSEALAVYAYMFYYLSVASIAVISASQISIPFFAELTSSIFQNKIFKKSLIRLSVYSLFFSLFVMTVSSELSEALYIEGLFYSVVMKVCISASSWFLFMSLYANAILMAKRDLKNLLSINVILLVLNIFITYGLVLNLGLEGAFLAFLVNSVILCASLWLRVRRVSANILLP